MPPVGLQGERQITFGKDVCPMKKFRLDIDELRVDSFTASPGRAGVHAHESATIYNTCRVDVCSGDSMCAGWCSNYDGCSNEGTCAVSCRSEPCVCIPQG